MKTYGYFLLILARLFL